VAGEHLVDSLRDSHRPTVGTGGLLALELELVRRGRVGLTAQPVAFAVGDERQLACGQAAAAGLPAPRASSFRR
jgi:hypothetical protein